MQSTIFLHLTSMRPNLYLSYMAGYSLPFEDFVEFAVTEGFGGVEFILDLSPNLAEEFDRSRIAALRTLKEKYGLHYTVHNVYMDINLTSLVPKVRYLAREITQQAMEFGKAVDAQSLIIHPGYRFGPWRTKPEQATAYEEVLRTSFLDLAGDSLDYGIPILVENGNYYLSSKNGDRTPLHIGIEKEELYSIARIPAASPFGICFDVGKAYMSLDTGHPREVVTYLEYITPLLREIHLNAFENYQEVAPLVLNYLHEIKFSGPIVFECARQNIPLLKKLFGLQ